MTKTEKVLAETQSPSKKSRPAIIAAALGAALCLAVAPLLTAQADASLSNGGFCIASSYDSEPDITGMAGAKNCGTVEAPTAPESQTRLLLMQRLELIPFESLFRQTAWAGGAVYDPRNGVLPPMMGAGSDGWMSCAAVFERCEFRTTAIDTRTNTAIASASFSPFGTVYSGMRMAASEPLVWKQDGVVSQGGVGVNEYTKLVDGTLSLAEAKAAANAPTLRGADDLRFEGQFYAYRNGTAELQGSVSIDSSEIECRTNQAEIDWKGEWLVVENVECSNRL